MCVDLRHLNTDFAEQFWKDSTGQAALGAVLLLFGGATFLWLHPMLRRTLAGALAGWFR